MIKTILTLGLLWISLTTIAQREFAMTKGDTTYIMKRYVFMHLLKGTERSSDSLEAAKLQERHLAHISKMAESGKLVMAGPFENGGEYRGILIFDVDSLEEAIKMESEDPAVKTNRLRMQAFYWWGAKGTILP